MISLHLIILSVSNIPSNVIESLSVLSAAVLNVSSSSSKGGKPNTFVK